MAFAAAGPASVKTTGKVVEPDFIAKALPSVPAGVDAVVREFSEHRFDRAVEDTEGAQLAQADETFFADLVKGVVSKQAIIDPAIVRRLASGWKLERLDATAVTAFLNRFLTPMTDAILERRGTIDKYMGDAIMAVFPRPLAALPALIHAQQLLADPSSQALPEGVTVPPSSLGPLGKFLVATGQLTFSADEIKDHQAAHAAALQLDATHRDVVPELHPGVACEARQCHRELARVARFVAHRM